MRNAEPEFRRSSYCDSGTCLEVAFPPGGGVVLRDGKHPSTSWHAFPMKAWAAFLDAVRAGKFDR